MLQVLAMQRLTASIKTAFYAQPAISIGKTAFGSCQFDRIGPDEGVISPGGIVLLRSEEIEIRQDGLSPDVC